MAEVGSFGTRRDWAPMGKLSFPSNAGFDTGPD